MKKFMLLLVCAVMYWGSVSWAAPLKHAQLPAESKWLVHVDFDKFATSEMWWLIKQEMSEKDQQKIDALTTLFGSDPTRDIYGVTIYGTDAEEEHAVLMINGRFNKEKLLSLLALNEDYAESVYEGRTLHHWVDEKDNKEKVGVFAADDLIVISETEGPVQAAIDLMAGRSESLARRKDAPLLKLTKAPEDTFMIMAADGVTELSQNNGHAAMLRNTRTMAAAVGETDGTMFMYVDMTTATSEAAVQIEQMLLGIKAFIELESKDQPEIKSLLQSIALERNDNQLFLSAKYPAAKLFAIAQTSHKAKKKSSAAEEHE